MKKAVLLFLGICVIVLSLGLVGCGGGKQENSSAVKQEAAPPAKEESVTELFSKGKSLPGMSYDFVMSAKESNVKGTMWISGKKMKSEMMVENEKTMTIIDGDAKVLYTYNPAQGIALKLPLDNKSKTAETPDKFTKDVDAGKVKVLETTTYEGVKCKVLLIQDADGKAQTKMWVREDYGIPLRVEVTDPSGEKMVMEYKNMKIGAQPADVFQLPSGVQVTDMGEMMKTMQKSQ